MKGLLFILLIFETLTLNAKVPIATYGSVFDKGQKRNPAQFDNNELNLYLDMECADFMNPSNKDPFIIYMRTELNKLKPHFCDLVQDSVSMDDDTPQFENEYVGLGTFSKLVETHFVAFSYRNKLDYYQGLNCFQLTDDKSDDGFVKFFKGYTTELNPHFCQLVNSGGDEDMDSDLSQAQRQGIGQGTFSKIIEDAFYEYYFSYENL